MNFRVTQYSDINALISERAQSGDDSLFRDAVENALSERGTLSAGCEESMILISSKLEEKLKNDPELAEDIYRRINEMCGCYGKNCRDNIVVVDRNGEIARYCPTHDKRKDRVTDEKLKEIAKARARKKAKLDAYFKLVERISIKRKLIEQENLKRGANKKYRYSVMQLDAIAKSISQKPSKEPVYFS